MERMSPVVAYPRSAQKLTADQIATRSTWARIPDTDLTKAAMHVVRVIPAGSTTITEMNPLDPGLCGESIGEGRGWLDPPAAYGHVARHGKVLA